MNKNHKWEDEMDRLRNSYFTEGFHCLVYNVSEAYNLVKAHKHDFPQFVIMQSGATRQTQSSRAYHLGSGDILFTPPAFTIKPACSVLTSAPPMRVPFSPACSINAPAKWPSGRLNTLPALG